RCAVRGHLHHVAVRGSLTDRSAATRMSRRTSEVRQIPQRLPRQSFPGAVLGTAAAAAGQEDIGAGNFFPFSQSSQVPLFGLQSSYAHLKSVSTISVTPGTHVVATKSMNSAGVGFPEAG